MDILIKVIVPSLGFEGEMCEGNAKVVKQLKTVQMTKSKCTRCSSTTRTTVARADLARYPLKINRNVKKIEW